MNLKDAFEVNVSIKIGGNSFRKKRKKKIMQDAYESFLKGKWGAVNRQPKVSKTFGSMG